MARAQGYYRNVLAVLRGEAKPDTTGGRTEVAGAYPGELTILQDGREVPLPLGRKSELNRISLPLPPFLIP